MNNSTIFKGFAMAIVAALFTIVVFVWPVPQMISAKDTPALFAGGAIVATIALIVILFVNKAVGKLTEKTDK
jgi:hypothetical protein